MADNQPKATGPDNTNIVDRQPSGHGPYHNLLVTPDGRVTSFRVYSESPPAVTLEEWRCRDARIAREQALYDRGAPVAGHDFAKEWHDRVTDDRGR